MRINETSSGILMQAFEMDIEVIKAQRQAELKNLAEYRQRHLKDIIEWSDPVKRMAKQKDAALALEESKKIVEERLKADPEYLNNLRSTKEGRYIGSGLAWLPIFKPLSERITIKEIVKPKTKSTWYQKLLAWFK